MSDNECADKGDWEAVGSDAQVRSVHTYALRCTAQEAAQRAFERVLATYGAGTDLSRWSVSVWGRGKNGGVRHRFHADANGTAIPLKESSGEYST